MAYNAAERKDVRRAEKEAKVAEQQRREVVVGLMATIAGRRWILELLEKCHVFSTSFNRDALGMAFSEGERNVGLRLLADIMESAPDNYILMMRERNERRSTSERTGSQDTNGRDQGPDPFDSTDDGDAEDVGDLADNSVHYDRG